MAEVVFKKLTLASGGVVVMKLETVGEVSPDKARDLEQAASRFRANRTSYYLEKGGTNKAVMAGLVRDFGAGRFRRDDVIQWCAFAGLDFTEHEISAALTHLARERHPPVKPTGKGSGASWIVNQHNLEDYLR